MFKRFWLPGLALWVGLAAALAALTTRVADWFVMTDELLYERLALSVVRLHSPLPYVHHQLIPNVNQLYPLLLSIPFALGGTVGRAMPATHALNAVVMSSAAVPAYLLARRVASLWPALLAAALTVAVPWISLASFLMTETAAYPAFLWAVLALQRDVAAPSRRRDVLAAAGLVLAVLARTQFAVLAVVLPVAVVARERSLRGAWRRHRLLGTLYAVGLVVLLALVAAGRNPLGTYSATTKGNPVPLGIVTAFATHLAAVGLGLALLPFLLGGAWLVAHLTARDDGERQSLALVATTAIVLLAFEVASYDIRFGGGLPRERYVFYVAPLFLVAFSSALAAREVPRRALAVPLVVLVYGFVRAPLPLYQKLNVDMPVAIFDNYLRRTLGGLDGARSFLVAAAVLCAVLLVEGSLLLRRTHLAAVLAALMLLALPAETAYAFQRLFAVDGTAGRPLTVDQSEVFDWVDRTVGSDADVTMVPYPTAQGDYWAGVAYWWDLEFWNESVDRSAGVPGVFEWTPPTFPKLALRFGPTGLANVSPPGYVAQAVSDARFHIAGTVVTNDRGLFLVRPEEPWRADWLTTGLYDDGWTRPGVTAHVRVFSDPGQTGRVTRSITVYAFAPPGVAARPFTLASNLGSWHGTAGANEVTQQATVCVPPHGSADVRLTVAGTSQVYGDPTSLATAGSPRPAGLLVARIYLSGQAAGSC